VWGEAHQDIRSRNIASSGARIGIAWSSLRILSPEESSWASVDQRIQDTPNCGSQFGQGISHRIGDDRELDTLVVVNDDVPQTCGHANR
jgi:hypothetical protein